MPTQKGYTDQSGSVDERTKWLKRISKIQIGVVIGVLTLLATTFGVYFNVPNTDFSVKVSNLEGTLTPGGSNSAIIEISGQDLSFAALNLQRVALKSYNGGDVMLAAGLNNTSMQSHISLFLTDKDDKPPYDSQLNVIADPVTPPGQYPVTITALSGTGRMHTCQYLLQVKGSTPDIKLSAIYQFNKRITFDSLRNEGKDSQISPTDDFFVHYSIAHDYARATLSLPFIVIAINPSHSDQWYVCKQGVGRKDGSGFAEYSAGPLNLNFGSRQTPSIGGVIVSEEGKNFTAAIAGEPLPTPQPLSLSKYTIAAIAVNATNYRQISAMHGYRSFQLQKISNGEPLDIVTIEANSALSPSPGIPSAYIIRPQNENSTT